VSIWEQNWVRYLKLRELSWALSQGIVDVRRWAMMDLMAQSRQTRITCQSISQVLNRHY